MHGKSGDLVTITNPPTTLALVFLDNKPGALSSPVVVVSATPAKMVVMVPYFSGELGFDGFIQVGSTCTVSGCIAPPRLPFHYDPIIDTKTLTLYNTNLNQSSFPQSDTHLTGPGAQDDPNSSVTYQWNGLIGGKGDDVFFNNIHLGRGWTVVSVVVTPRVLSGKAGASVVESRVGTDMPYVKVHWWGDLFSSLSYSVAVTVQGPRGERACAQCTGHSNFAGNP
jgi:hypothetical protein